MDWFNERVDLIVRDAVRKQLKNQYFGDIEIWRLFTNDSNDRIDFQN